MSLRRLVVCVSMILSGLAGTAAADVSFPARLQVEEREAGVYHVVFNLPLIEGRKLRAHPLLPPQCTDITAPIVTASATDHTTTWTTRCEPASLAGEAILVDGLLGTQTELAFTLSTLDGRVYSRILRPSRPGFLVPDPPSMFSLAREAAVTGMRRILREPPLWLLIAMAILVGARRRELATAAGIFALSHGLAQWLGAHGWLEVTISARDAVTLVSVAVPAAALAGAGRAWRGWLKPPWPMALLLGLLYGGALPENLPPDGLSQAEQVLATALFAAGIGLGLLLMAAIWTELDSAARVLGAERHKSAVTVTAFALGGAATGLLFTRVAAQLLMWRGISLESLGLWFLAAMLGIGLGAAGRRSSFMLVPFAVLLCCGGAAGLAGWPLPLGNTLAHASLIVLGVAMTLGKPPEWRWMGPVAVVATTAVAWTAARTIAENSSRSTGVAAGVGVVACCVLFASTTAGRRASDVSSHPGLRVFGAAVAVAAFGVHLLEVHEWIDRQFATDLALGVLRLPVLALLLLAAAAIAWPRRRKLMKEIGLEQPKRATHWLLLGAAFLLFTYGTLGVPIPFYQPHAPRGEAARRVAENVLDSTYRAFNLGDEDELYDRLSDSVSVEMVDQIYLDSRRRLTTGTRKGAEVTVREVSVLEISEPAVAMGAETAFEYSCRWVVVARVSHLQHVHHRRNTYSGILTLRVDDDRWKIAGVELLSEDREVVSWKPV